MAVLSPEEVRRLNAEFMQECRKELLKKGVFSKGLRVPSDKLRACFKAKWQEYKKRLVAERL